MIITKIIPGFVSQRFDTEKQCWLDQEFVGGDSEIFDWLSPGTLFEFLVAAAKHVDGGLPQGL